MTKKRVAIVQSNYIPWRGYFDLIGSVDEFIVYDDMQYTRRDWRNRNKIKTNTGVQWLTIPVDVKGKYLQKIRDTQIADQNWAAKHWKTLCYCYKNAPYFLEVSEILEPLYMLDYQTISQVNLAFIKSICSYLGIYTRISYSWDYQLVGERSERLASLVEQAGGTQYFSGPAAESYLEYGCFDEKNIEVRWFDYTGYRPYDQLWGPYQGELSIVDLLFNHGDAARSFLLINS